MFLSLAFPRAPLFAAVRPSTRFAFLRAAIPAIFRVLAVAGLSTLAAVDAGAQAGPAPEIGAPPAWVVPAAWTAPEKLQENSSGEDFLLLDEQTSLATSENYHHRVYQIVTDSGRQSSAQVYFYFDPSYQKLAIHQLKLIRAGDVSDRLNPEKIQVLQQERDLDSQLYNGERSALVILDDVRVGDIIDLAYTLRGANPVFAGKFIDTVSLDWGVPVRQQSYRLRVPAGRAVLSRVQGSAQATFSTQAHDGEQEMTWRRSNLPIIESEDKVPSSHVVYSFLDLSEFGSWRDVVKWALPMYALDDAPRPLLDATVADIRNQSGSPEQQAVAALAFVQQQIRYLGIEMGPGSHRPSDPEEVLRRRFGDCKDKARLLVALLRGLGLEAAPALVHGSRREAVRDRLPTPYAFNHVITALDLGGRRYLLDGTLSYQRGDRLALRHVGNYGPYLRIADSTTELETAELGAFDTSNTVCKELFQVDALEKPAAFTVTTVAAGRAADDLRAYFATHTLEQIGREYLNYYTRYFPSITQLKPIATADNPAENSYTVTEYYQVKQLFVPDADNKILRAEFEPPSIWEYVRTPNLAQRAQPYAISFPTHVEEQITVNLPEDWKVTPYEEKVSDAVFTLTALAKNLNPRTVHMEYSWESKAHRVEPARLAEYSANAEKARKALGYNLTWRRPVANAMVTDKPAPPVKKEDSFPLNWPMIALATGLSLAGSYSSWRLIKTKKPALPAPPVIDAANPALAEGSPPATTPGQLEGLGGWLILVAFGLIVRPFVVLKTIVDSHRAYFNASSWNLLTTPGNPAYNSNFALVAPLELIFNITFFIYCCLLLILFFRRSYLFPRAMQLFFGFLVFGAGFGIWDTIALSSAPDAGTAVAGYTTLFQSVVAAAIWIPYFQVSLRVKATFTR